MIFRSFTSNFITKSEVLLQNFIQITCGFGRLKTYAFFSHFEAAVKL